MACHTHVINTPVSLGSKCAIPGAIYLCSTKNDAVLLTILPVGDFDCFMFRIRLCFINMRYTFKGEASGLEMSIFEVSFSQKHFMKGFYN